MEHKPFALVYEEILLAGATPDKQSDEQEMKRRIANLVGELIPNEFHRSIANSPVKHILTTNYDYCFELASIHRNTRSNLQVETKYSVFRRRTIGEQSVWHIHGEVAVPNSITLGYDQYSGYLQKLRGHATAGRDSEGGSPFKRGDMEFDSVEGTTYSWLDVFLRDDIHILGLALDYTEIDLWWALTYKARLKARGMKVGKTIYHDWHLSPLNDASLAKQSLLQGLAVEVTTVNCARGFEPAYSKFVETYL